MAWVEYEAVCPRTEVPMQHKAAAVHVLSVFMSVVLSLMFIHKMVVNSLAKIAFIF